MHFTSNYSQFVRSRFWTFKKIWVISGLKFHSLGKLGEHFSLWISPEVLILVPDLPHLNH